MENLIFFDDECPLCHRAVCHILEIDRDKRFMFAPLKGETSDRILSGPLKHFTSCNSLVVIENYQSTQRKIWVRSKAIWRIYWIVGNGWKLIGWLCFLPSCMGDFFYRMFSEHRHQFKLKPRQDIKSKERFLP